MKGDFVTSHIEGVLLNCVIVIDLEVGIKFRHKFFLCQTLQRAKSFPLPPFESIVNRQAYVIGLPFTRDVAEAIIFGKNKLPLLENFPL
jgi:hypothetical protein